MSDQYDVIPDGEDITLDRVLAWMRFKNGETKTIEDDPNDPGAKLVRKAIEQAKNLNEKTD